MVRRYGVSVLLPSMPRQICGRERSRSIARAMPVRVIRIRKGPDIRSGPSGLPSAYKHYLHTPAAVLLSVSAAAALLVRALGPASAAPLRAGGHVHCHCRLELCAPEGRCGRATGVRLAAACCLCAAADGLPQTPVMWGRFPQNRGLVWVRAVPHQPPQGRPEERRRTAHTPPFLPFMYEDGRSPHFLRRLLS